MSGFDPPKWLRLGELKSEAQRLGDWRFLELFEGHEVAIDALPEPERETARDAAWDAVESRVIELIDAGGTDEARREALAACANYYERCRAERKAAPK